MFVSQLLFYMSCAVCIHICLVHGSDSSSSDESYAFGESELISLRDDIRALMLANEVGLNADSPIVAESDILFSYELPIIASSVRLAFHDCAGEYPAKCNGCIILDSRPNAKLFEGSVDPLSSICNEYKNDYGLSIADCWALAATFGIELSSELTMSDWDEINFIFNGDLDGDKDYPSKLMEPGDIPYYVGRIDCATSPDTEDGIEEQLPSPRDTWINIQHYFGDRFGITNKEIVALISGGHSLGRGHSGAPGPGSGPWDISPNTLDNEYHKALLGQNRILDPFNWQRGRLNGAEVGPVQFFVNYGWTEFGFPFNDALLMLSADISLAFNRSSGSDCMTMAIEYCDENYPSTIVLYTDDDESNYPADTVFCPFRQCPVQCEGGESQLQDYIDNDFDNLDENGGCPAAWIRQFADDMDNFGDTFLRAYTKVITAGYVISEDSSDGSSDDSSDDTSENTSDDLDYLVEIEIDWDSWD